MNRHPTWLVARLIALQLVVHTLTFFLTAAFAPRVLLLEPTSSSASTSIVIAVGVLCAVFSTSATFVVMHRLRPTLRDLALGLPCIKPADVRALYAVPAHLAVASTLFAPVLAGATVLPSLRPQALDTSTDLALVLLVVTMVSTAALPAYVLMRASVARVLELVPAHVAHEALLRLGRAAGGRVRNRLVASVVAPVAFVALGASLLVDAHSRAYDHQARIADATDFAQAVFEHLENGQASELASAGHAQVIEAAALLGFRVTLDPANRSELAVRRGDDGETQVTVPLTPGAALVRFGAGRLEAGTWLYVGLAFAAVALSALLGTRMGAVFNLEVARATRQMNCAGIGPIVIGESRFTKMHALLEAVETLGRVFGEFARAQQRSIDAREATERMRALLLASMSHDLKAPLNAVLGFAELARRNSLSELQRESLAIIEQRGRELLMLIDTILDSARVEACELVVSPELTHVGDVVMASVLEARDFLVGDDVQIYS